MNIAVVGTGYVGLVTGACLSHIGHDVFCVDKDSEKIKNLKCSVIPIYEPELAGVVNANIGVRLHFTSNIITCSHKTDVFFIAVGTPQDEDGRADLSYVLSVAEELGQTISKDCAVVVKSTVPVGTNDIVFEIIKNGIQQRGLDIDVKCISNPEFLREGNAVADFMNPDRIIVGARDSKSISVMKDIYSYWSDDKLVFMDVVSAELTKYAANAMLATRISFMNEMANLCESVGADIDKVKAGIGKDDRIGSKFLNAGCGYGGSCFPKDVKALIRIADDNNIALNIVRSVQKTNDYQRTVIYHKLMKIFNNNLAGKKIALLGIAFKPDTDDIRESPTIYIADLLIRAGAEVVMYDPMANQASVDKCFDRRVVRVNSRIEAFDNTDAVAIITDWQEFKSINWSIAYSLMKSHIVVDGRNMLNEIQMFENGFDYYCIGK